MGLVKIISEIKKDTLGHYKNAITRSRYVEDINRIRAYAAKVETKKEPSAADFLLIKQLEEVYIPAQKGIISSEEEKLVYETLEIQHRTLRDLNNLRNTVVMYGDISEKFGFDRVSAITYVIDKAVMKLGGKI